MAQANPATPAPMQEVYDALEAAHLAHENATTQAEKDSHRRNAQELADYIRSQANRPPEKPEEEKAGITRSIADAILELGTGTLGFPANISQALGSDPVTPTSAELNRMLAERGIHSGAGVEDVGLSERTDEGRFAKVASDIGLTAVPIAGATGMLAQGAKPLSAYTPTVSNFIRTKGSSGPDLHHAPGYMRGLRPESPGEAIIREVSETAAKTPRAFLGAELTAAGTAGVVGAAAGEIFPEIEGAETVGGIVGGILNPATTVPALAQGGGKVFNSIMSIFSKAGQERRAANIIAEVVEQNGGDINEVLKLLLLADDVPSIAPSAIKTGDKGLAALQRFISQKSPDTSKALNEATEKAFQEMRDTVSKLRNTGDPQALRVAALLEREMIKDQVDQAVQIAQTDVDLAASKIDIGTTVEDTGIAVREVLDQASKKLRLIEKILWNKLPDNVNLVPKNTSQAWLKIQQDEAPELLTRRIPADFQKLLKRFGKSPMVSSKELKKFRSDLRSLAADFRSGQSPNRDGARLLEELAESVGKDMEGLANYDTAREFTSAFHEKFTKTFVGKIQSRTAYGGQGVAPESTLKDAFSGGSATGSTRLGQIEEAAILADKNVLIPLAQTKAAQKVLEEQEKFLKTLAQKYLNDDNTIKPGLANFIRNNKKLLERFPGLREEFTDMQSMSNTLKDVKIKEAKRQSDFDKSAFGQVAGSENSDQVIGTILAGKTPSESYSGLATAAKDSSKSAVDGLRTATLENRWNAVGKSKTPFQNFQDNMEDVFPLMELNGVMSPEDISRLKRLVSTAARMERNATEVIGRAGDVASPVESNALDTIIRITGAKLGASVAGKTSGATLVAAGQGSKFLRKLLENTPFDKTFKILEQAALDPQLMADLLIRSGDPKLQVAAFRRIHAALFSAAIVEEPPEQQEEKMVVNQ